MKVRSGVLVLLAECAWAQGSAQELADRLAQPWTSGSEAEFAAVYPFREGRAELASAASKGVNRTKGLASVLRDSGQRAFLLLSGVRTMDFSGLYEASAGDG